MSQCSENNQSFNIINNNLIGISTDENSLEQDSNEENIAFEFNSHLEPVDFFLKLGGYSIKELRSIKLEIEEAILKKINKLENLEKDLQKGSQRNVFYTKHFSIDKIGLPVLIGETGIAEGWRVPIYKNEFHNLLGLPFTEDHALAETLRIKRPRQECFNCLANHRVQDCPVRLDEERIAIHRELFNAQSMQSQEQMNLWSNRYTNDPDSKLNRGFTPGKFSDQLKEALGLRPNQLPPFVYMMREYGYPVGWLIEAKVNKSKLAVLNGDDSNAIKNSTDNPENSILTDDESKTKEKLEENLIEYDANRIFSFPGFNEQPESGILEECDIYKVKRYEPNMSKEKFLSTLNLEKKKIVRRRTNEVAKVELEQTENEEDADKNSEINDSNENSSEKNSSNQSIEEAQEELGNDNAGFISPKKRKSISLANEHGTSFTEILGTPIVNNVAGITRVPDWEKFSENICEHKPFEMNSNTPTGSYKNIVKLTKEFKNSPTPSIPPYNNDQN